MPPRSSLHPPGDRTLARVLCEWFDAHARDLPWRRRRTGYRALVSELMLQQTQVARVIEPYRQFMRAFPTIKALAAADEQAVLAAWQGLGYYRRAKMLHRAARAIVDDHRGRVPREAATLRQLPGVGAYTAGSIASIVYHQPEPIVDGNVYRVLSRLHDRPGAGRSTGDMRWAWTAAEQLVDATERPGILNEALMELGGTICAPRAPHCEKCPMARWCGAFRNGRQHEIPRPAGGAKRPTLHHHAVIIRRGVQVLVEQRPETGLWAGLWQVPTLESSESPKPDELVHRLPVRVMQLQPIGGFEHHTTHRRILFQVYTARSRARRGIWRPGDQLDDLPMSNAQRKVLGVLGDDLC